MNEAATSVIMEALSLGLPVICHDASGMGEAVTGLCGIKVPLANPAKSIEGFSNAIQRLVENPELLKRLSGGALDRARELSWDGIAKRISDAYGEYA